MLLPIEDLQKITRFEHVDNLNQGSAPYTRIRVYFKKRGIFGGVTEGSKVYDYYMRKVRTEDDGTRIYDTGEDAKEFISQLKFYCTQKWEKAKETLEPPPKTKKEDMFGVER